MKVAGKWLKNKIKKWSCALVMSKAEQAELERFLYGGQQSHMEDPRWNQI